MFYQYNVYESPMGAPTYCTLGSGQSVRPSRGNFCVNNAQQTRSNRYLPIQSTQWQGNVPCMYYPAEDSESSDDDFELYPFGFQRPPVLPRVRATPRKVIRPMPQTASYMDEWIPEPVAPQYTIVPPEPYREYDSFLKRRNVDLFAPNVSEYNRYVRAKIEQEEQALAAQRLEARCQAEERSAALRREKQRREAHALQAALERIALEEQEEKEEEPHFFSLISPQTEIHSPRRSRHHHSSKKQKSVARQQKADLARKRAEEERKQLEQTYFLVDLIRRQEKEKLAKEHDRAEAEKKRAKELKKKQEQQQEQQQREQQQREAEQQHQKMLRALKVETAREFVRRAAREDYEEMNRLAEQQQQHEESVRRSAIEFSNGLSQKELEKLQAKREHEARQRVMSHIRRPSEEENAVVKEEPKPQFGDNAVEVTSPDSVPSKFWQEFSEQLSEMVADNDPTISENDIITITITERGKVNKFYVPASRVASLKAARKSKDVPSAATENKSKSKSLKSKKSKSKTSSPKAVPMEIATEPETLNVVEPKVIKSEIEEPKVEEPMEWSKVEEPKVEEPSDCESEAENFTVIKDESSASMSRASSPSTSIRHVTIEDIEDSDASSDFN